MKRYLIIAGETSGDQHGGNLISAIKKSHHEKVEFWGIGGTTMHKVGLHQLEVIDNISIVGFSEALKKLPSMVVLLNRIIKFIEDMNPDGVILIDYPGFNLKLASKIKKKSPNTKIHFFISPQIWAWNEKRIKIIKNYIDQMIVIFPFEEPYYKKHGINVKYVGHPFLDHWKSREISMIRDNLGLPKNKKIIGVFPGSRTQELKTHLPIYIDAINKINKNTGDVFFALGLADGFIENDIRQQYDLNIKIISDNAIDLLECSDVAIATSGTVSLQATFVDTPCVVSYKLSRVSGFISKMLVKVPYISMTNIIANEMILPELTQSEVSANNIQLEVMRFINDQDYLQNVKKKMKKVTSEFLTKTNSIQNAAELIINIDDTKN